MQRRCADDEREPPLRDLLRIVLRWKILRLFPAHPIDQHRHPPDDDVVRHPWLARIVEHQLEQVRTAERKIERIGGDGPPPPPPRREFRSATAKAPPPR